MRKALRILSLVFLLPMSVYALSVGPNSVTSGTDDASAGTLAWLNPGNITSSDDAYATAAILAAGITTHYLKGLAPNFSIPNSATIDGILLEIERGWTGGNGAPEDVRVSLVRAGAIETTNKAVIPGGWGAPEQYVPYGGATDLWGAAWTPADINNANFGAVFSVQFLGAFGTTVRVDHMRFTVYYHVPIQGLGYEDFF